MPINPFILERLQTKFKERTPQVTALERVRRGQDYDPENVNDRDPSLPQWLYSDFDKNPVEKESTANRFVDQLSSVRNLGSTANEIASDEVAHKAQLAAAKKAAELQARYERQNDLIKQLGDMDYTGYLDYSGGNGKVTNKRQAVLNAAKRWLGTPYSWGGGGGKSRGRSGPTYGIDRGSGTKGFDCSGLTDYAFSQIGFSIGASTYSQLPWAKARGKIVSMKKLVPGDLVFGGSTSSPHHVAIYWGNGKIIEAPYTGGRVRIVPMRSGQYGVHLNY